MPFKFSSVILCHFRKLWKFDNFLSSSTHKIPCVFVHLGNFRDSAEPPADLELIVEWLECSALS